MSAGWRAHRVGGIHSFRGQSAEVLACASRAKAFWDKAGAGSREKAIAIHLRAVGYKLADDYSAAKDAYREAIDISRTLGRDSPEVFRHCTQNPR